jgi:hypothetical protein
VDAQHSMLVIDSPFLRVGQNLEYHQKFFEFLPSLWTTVLVQIVLEGQLPVGFFEITV